MIPPRADAAPARYSLTYQHSKIKLRPGEVIDAATRNSMNTETGNEPGLRVSFLSDRMSNSARRKLVNLLIGKSIVETILVGSLAVAFYYTTFHPSFSGSVDLANERVVEGWVVDTTNPSARVEVQLFIDGRFTAAGIADQPRPDVKKAGWAPDDLHGFRFSISVNAGEHEARIYAVHSSNEGTVRTLQQIGSARHFSSSVSAQPK